MTGCNKQQNKGKLFLLIILLFGLLAVGAAVCFGGRENAPKPDEDAEPVRSFSHGSSCAACRRSAIPGVESDPDL